MKALGKILGLVVLGLLLLIVGLGFALTHLFDPNDYKDEIRRLAREKAGLELGIDGNIGWSLFPWLGLELQDTRLASVRTPDQPFANLRMLGLSIRVLPLLQRQIQMSDITVDGLALTLARDEQGKGNWEGVGQPPATTQDQATTAQEQTPETPAGNSDEPDSAAKPLVLDIDSLTVKNSSIAYRDARSGQQFGAENIALTTGTIREGAPVPLKLNALFSTNQPVMRVQSELQGNLRFDTGLKRYQFEGLKLTGEASGEPLKGKTATFSAQGELLADLTAQTAEWNAMKLDINQLRTLGELKAHDLQSEPKFSGTLSIAQFNLGDFLQGIGQQLPAMADDKALDSVELVTQLAGTQKSLALEKLNLKLDGSTLTGRLAIDDFATQALRVDLKGDRLDLDRYLPPADQKDQTASAARKSEVQKTEAGIAAGSTTPLPDKPTQQSWSNEKILPLEQLRRLDTQLSFAVGQLTLARLPLENFSMKARSAAGQLRLEELRSNLHGGQIQANASLDARSDNPQIGFQGHIANVPVEQMLEAKQQKDIVKGLLDLNTKLRTQGNSQRAWVNALDGTLDFALKNGVLVQANLEQQICRAIATLNRKALSSEPRAKDTPFRKLGGSLTFNNGVASNRDLQASIPGLTVKGNGDVDLRVLGMDYRIGVLLEGDKSDMPDPACQINERYTGIELPLRCRGPLELGAKACRLDQDGLTKIATKLAGDKLQDKLDEKIDKKLGDKVSPELKDKLKGLFNR